MCARRVRVGGASDSLAAVNRMWKLLSSRPKCGTCTAATQAHCGARVRRAGRQSGRKYGRARCWENALFSNPGYTTSGFRCQAHVAPHCKMPAGCFLPCFGHCHLVGHCELSVFTHKTRNVKVEPPPIMAPPTVPHDSPCFAVLHFSSLYLIIFVFISPLPTVLLTSLVSYPSLEGTWKGYPSRRACIVFAALQRWAATPPWGVFMWNWKTVPSWADSAPHQGAPLHEQRADWFQDQAYIVYSYTTNSLPSQNVQLEGCRMCTPKCATLA